MSATVDLRAIREAAEYAIDHAAVRASWSGETVPAPEPMSLDPQTVLRMVAVCEAAIALGTGMLVVRDGENLDDIFGKRAKLRHAFNDAVRAISGG